MPSLFETSRGRYTVVECCASSKRKNIKNEEKKKKSGNSVGAYPKIPVWWRRTVLPSLPWVVCFLSFFLHWARDWRALALNTGTPVARTLRRSGSY